MIEGSDFEIIEIAGPADPFPKPPFADPPLETIGVAARSPDDRQRDFPSPGMDESEGVDESKEIFARLRRSD